MFHILIVEDTPEYQLLVRRTLGEYRLTFCASAKEATVLLKEVEFDILLIDINLPDCDGFSFLSDLRSSPQTALTPIICLTGRSNITDKITAFSLGADDYVTKPFEPLELKARVEGRLKRLAKTKKLASLTVVGDLEIDHNCHRVALQSEGTRRFINLTQTEFKLLSCLSRRPEQVYTRHQLLDAAWGENADVLERVVDVHVCSLRKKLGTHGRSIKAVNGMGYKLSPFTPKPGPGPGADKEKF